MRSLRLFRACAFVEGISYLVLLLVAMPLKYGFDLPLAVRIVGSAHGALFVSFCAGLAWVTFQQRWPLRKASLAMLLSLVPGGTFLLDRTLKHEIAELQGRAPAPSRS